MFYLVLVCVMLCIQFFFLKDKFVRHARVWVVQVFYNTASTTGVWGWWYFISYPLGIKGGNRVNLNGRAQLYVSRVPGFSATEQDSRVRINALSNCDLPTNVSDTNNFVNLHYTVRIMILWRCRFGLLYFFFVYIYFINTNLERFNLH